MKNLIEKIKSKAKLPMMAILAMVAFSFAAIVAVLALPVLVGGSTGEPFVLAITGASVGTIVDPATVTGANVVAGSSAETVDLSITNNANQPISMWLEYSCGSTDNSLTTAYIDVEFDAVAAQHTCDVSNRAYAYRTFAAESVGAGVTQTPQVSYEFPITGTGYFTGNWDCSAKLVTAKAC